MPSGWKTTLDDVLWHELLLPFVGVKRLHIGSSLTPELSQALQSVAGELVLELLPGLQELEVPLEIDNATNAFSKFLNSRQSVGRPVHLSIPPEDETTINIKKVLASLKRRQQEIRLSKPA